MSTPATGGNGRATNPNRDLSVVGTWKVRCDGVTGRGRPCKNWASTGDTRCATHSEGHQAKVAAMKAEIIASLEERPGVTAAARKVGVSTNTIYNWRDADEDFAAALHEAQELTADMLESTLWDEAVHGVRVDYYDRAGNVTSSRIERNTTAAMFLLRGRRRDVFGERVAVDHGVQRNVAEEARLVAAMRDPEVSAAIDATLSQLEAETG